MYVRSLKKQESSRKNISVCSIDYAKAFDYVDHNKLENSERDGNTRPPDLPLEKSVCRPRNNRNTHLLLVGMLNGTATLEDV